MLFFITVPFTLVPFALYTQIPTIPSSIVNPSIVTLSAVTPIIGLSVFDAFIIEAWFSAPFRVTDLFTMRFSVYTSTTTFSL